MAWLSIALLIALCFWIAEFSAYNTGLKNLERNITINITGENSGNIEVNISENAEVQKKREELIQDIIWTSIKMAVTAPTCAITTTFALKGSIKIKMKSSQNG